MLLSGYDYSAIVLVDSRHLYPIAAAAGAVRNDDASISLSQSSVKLATVPSLNQALLASARSLSLTSDEGKITPPSVTEWNTPKSPPDEGEGAGVSLTRGEGTGRDEETDGDARSSRRRIKREPADQRDVADRFPREDSTLTSASLPPAADGVRTDSALPETMEDGTCSRYLRVPAALCPTGENGISRASSFCVECVTPPVPRRSRKRMLDRGDESGGSRILEAARRSDGGLADASRKERENDLQAPSVSPSPFFFAAPALSGVGTPTSSHETRCGSGSSSSGDGSSPLSAFLSASSPSPPTPLKPSTLCNPVMSTPILSRSSSGSSVSSRADSPQPPASPDTSYCGHYILLVGWSEADRVFIARDPGLPSSSTQQGSTSAVRRREGTAGEVDPDAHVCIALSPEALDRARRSYGTDEDVLVIDLARSRRGGVTAAPLAAAAAATALAASAATSAAAASAVVGLIAMAAAAAAAGAGADTSTFREWGWQYPAAWFGGSTAGEGGSQGGSGKSSTGVGKSDTKAEAEVENPAGVKLTEGVFPLSGLSGAESAAKRLSSMLSIGASAWRFPAVGDYGYRSPWVMMWENGGNNNRGSGDGRTDVAERVAAAEGERWAVRMASAVEVFMQGGRRAAYTMEGLLQGGAQTMEELFQGGGRRAAYTMEGLLEGGRRAAYSLRDSLADVADAPGGAGAECYTAAAIWEGSPSSPVSSRVKAVMSPA